MYHIRNDKRTKRSAEKIWKALLVCLNEKAFQDITVMNITKECGMARTTFYRCFDNTADILIWKCDQSFHEVLDSYHPEQFGGELDLARHYFTYWTTHYEILELLIKIGRQDVIYTCHMKNADILAVRYGVLPDLPKEHANYFLAVRTGFTISMLTAWLKGGRKESTDELLAIMHEQIRFLSKDINRK
jgi:AcrR family transcriptional regulator